MVFLQNHSKMDFILNAKISHTLLSRKSSRKDDSDLGVWKWHLFRSESPEVYVFVSALSSFRRKITSER